MSLKTVHIEWNGLIFCHCIWCNDLSKLFVCVTSDFTKQVKQHRHKTALLTAFADEATLYGENPFTLKATRVRNTQSAYDFSKSEKNIWFYSKVCKVRW